MPISVGAPRLLLRRLREVMAERESAQARLDKVVVLIASNMVARCARSISAAATPPSSCSLPKA
jgi:Signal transduction protein containing GAF and PtsI domains